MWPPISESDPPAACARLGTPRRVGPDAGRTDHKLQTVIAQPNETREQALCRVGIEGDAKDVLVVAFAQWYVPHKAKAGHRGGFAASVNRGFFGRKKTPGGGLEEAKGFEPLMEF